MLYRVQIMLFPEMSTGKKHVAVVPPAYRLAEIRPPVSEIELCLRQLLAGNMTVREEFWTPTPEDPLWSVYMEYMHGDTGFSSGQWWDTGPLGGGSLDPRFEITGNVVTGESYYFADSREDVLLEYNLPY